jgi:Protein of unknown function (DUF1524)
MTPMRHRRLTTLLAAAASTLALAACHNATAAVRPDTSPAAAALAQLRVAPAGPMTGYTRTQFGAGWATGPDGCDTRVAVLKHDGRRVTAIGCRITGGTWLSLYDGLTVTVPSQLDIDHLVPLAEAWRTGAAMWPAARRAAFANDLVELVAVTAHSNRSKGDQPPPGYEPIPAERCDYATRWISVKRTYQLTVTAAERDELARMLTTCPRPR